MRLWLKLKENPVAAAAHAVVGKNNDNLDLLFTSFDSEDDDII